MKALEKLREIAASFATAGIEDPAKEAEILITETLRTDRSRLYTSDPEITEETSLALDSLALRRTEGEPLQYITGRVEFCGLTIRIGKGVLIPRPETELLVEEALKVLGREPFTETRPLRILDLCTGSGCIAISLAKKLPGALVCGTDRSETALACSRRNARENGVDNISFLQGDLFEPLRGERFHCLVSNPPYIRRGDIPGLQREVREHEPHEALDGGEDGLEFYRRIIAEGPSHLEKDGVMLMEIGHDQAGEIEEIARAGGLRDIRFVKDYAGIRRIFVARRQAAS